LAHSEVTIWRKIVTAGIPQFDPVKYKQTTRDQWQTAAEAWHRWGPTIEQWLGLATEEMLTLASVKAGSAVLDVAAGAGGQTLTAARRVGSNGYILATDIAPDILKYAAQEAQKAGFSHVETLVLDGENLDVEPSKFDAVISRVGLIYFPNQQKALTDMYRALKPGGRIAAIVYSTGDNNKFFSVPISIVRRRAQLPPPLPGQPGPFSLGNSGALEEAYKKAGFHDIQIRVVAAPLHMTSASEYVRFARESFGALHQMLAGITSEAERQDVWNEIEQQSKQFEGAGGYEGPCELVIGIGVK
jgi:ubiquinone/menaquinone biosynthesis C-methylase UbiE